MPSFDDLNLNAPDLDLDSIVVLGPYEEKRFGDMVLADLDRAQAASRERLRLKQEILAALEQFLPPADVSVEERRRIRELQDREIALMTTAERGEMIARTGGEPPPADGEPYAILPARTDG